MGIPCFIIRTTNKINNALNTSDIKLIYTNYYYILSSLTEQRSVQKMSRWDRNMFRNGFSTLHIDAIASQLIENTRPDTMFVSNLRMSKTTFMLLCGELEPFIRSSDATFRRAMSVQHRVAITIWRLATNAEYRTISHLFGIDHGVDCAKVLPGHLKTIGTKMHVHVK